MELACGRARQPFIRNRLVAVRGRARLISQDRAPVPRNCRRFAIRQLRGDRLRSHAPTVQHPRARLLAGDPFRLHHTGLRYGIDLRLAWPVDAIRATKVPILLIHGALDGNIPPRHSQELHAASLATSRLWVVDKADHVASLSTASDGYVRNVLAWFQSHP